MKLVEHAQAILAAGVAAVEPARRVAEALADEPEIAAWVADLARGVPGGGGSTSDGAGRTALMAVGKAAPAMARGALAVLGDAVDEGIVLAPDGGASFDGLPDRLTRLRGGHPLPTPAGVEAAAHIARLAEGLGASDRLLVLLSGGGSALLTLPDGALSVEDVAEATRVLQAAGLPIDELNAVRKHLDVLKGGGLARWAAPARVLGLVLSDVPGDAVATVASGPLSPDPKSFRDVEILLRRRELWDRLPGAVRRHLREGREGARVDTPGPDDPAFERVKLRVVGGGGRALEGAAAEARRLGYAVHVLTDRLEGEARAAGRGLARVGRAVRDGVGPVRPPACVLAAGETTVRVVGSGRGGRNQEVAVAAGRALDGSRGILVASLGTDGIDGPTDAAGGWADGDTAARARALGLDAEVTLAANDAYPYLDAVGGLLRTGPTGTNVADLMLVLIASDPR